MTKDAQYVNLFTSRLNVLNLLYDHRIFSLLSENPKCLDNILSLDFKLVEISKCKMDFFLKLLLLDSDTFNYIQSLDVSELVRLKNDDKVLVNVISKFENKNNILVI